MNPARGVSGSAETSGQDTKTALLIKVLGLAEKENTSTASQKRNEAAERALQEAEEIPGLE